MIIIIIIIFSLDSIVNKEIYGNWPSCCTAHAHYYLFLPGSTTTIIKGDQYLAN